jgi:hypothetical protein
VPLALDHARDLAVREEEHVAALVPALGQQDDAVVVRPRADALAQQQGGERLEIARIEIEQRVSRRLGDEVRLSALDRRLCRHGVVGLYGEAGVGDFAPGGAAQQTPPGATRASARRKGLTAFAETFAIFGTPRGKRHAAGTV